MDLMTMRRALLMALGGDDMTPWKTVTLTEDRKTDAVATMAKWEDFLEITLLTDLDDYTYVAIFSDNTQSSYKANVMCWTNLNGTFKRGYIRSDFGSFGGNNASCYANSGTTINIYKLPHM